MDDYTNVNVNELSNTRTFIAYSNRNECVLICGYRLNFVGMNFVDCQSLQPRNCQYHRMHTLANTNHDAPCHMQTNNSSNHSQTHVKHIQPCVCVRVCSTSIRLYAFERHLCVGPDGERITVLGFSSTF